MKKAIVDPVNLVRELLLQCVLLHLINGSRLRANDRIDYSTLEDVVVKGMKIRKRGRKRVKE